MSDKQYKFPYMLAVIIAIAAIVVICIVSVFFGILPLDALPANYIGAALGSLIGALITLVLLRGQTDIEEKRGKDVRILEKKTKVFQNYIRDVWKVWEDQKVTIEEFQDLTSKYYQNLMIYLKKERLDKIGDKLSEMGKNIGKNEPEAISNLRGSIVGIINELSAELELGGQVNTDIMDEHDKIVFPLLFKNSILEAANKVLPTGLEKGKFEYLDGRYYSKAECLCFNFIKYKGCRIIIDGFDGYNKLVFIFAVDTKYHKFDDFRATGKYYRQRINIEHNLLQPVDDRDNEKLQPINFSDEKSMDFYREKREFAEVLANRIKYYFDKTAYFGRI
jgi:hypothetical protein